MSRQLVTQALALMCANYVFPAKAEEAAALIRTPLDAGEYDDLGEEALGERLTEQLYAVCADKHLRVRRRDTELHDALTEEQARAVWLEQSRLGNYGVARVERSTATSATSACARSPTPASPRGPSRRRWNSSRTHTR